MEFGSEPQYDFVDDRALEDAAEDKFGHADFAAQVARTIRVVKTPANVAVYAPWGAGKTTLANLIQRELTGTRARFVYFNAFKYAKNPLRRQFISQVARALEVTNEKFSQGLYEEEVKSGISMRKSALKPFLLAVSFFAMVALALTALLALAVAQFSSKPLGDEWVVAMRRFVPTILGSSVVIAALITLARQALDVTRKRYAPESDEEFERLFVDLVSAALGKRKEHDRLVVFIDELDRCAADEVASTLETIRTFLEVDDCVFIVAADRQVLETAVARQARQETPYDTRNPYYSAGSAYLDKIFQYQWQLPPLMPTGLTRFAQDLVTGRDKGVWAEVDPGQVVPVLVPLHVQSPRRVKELLNAFAMTYRIADLRRARGRLEADLPARSAELAKLVCLQLEFPIFAADLQNEYRLPELLLTRHEGPDAERPADVSEEVWERAGAYAAKRLELDTVISRAHPHANPETGEPSDDEPKSSDEEAVGFQSPERRVEGIVAVQGQLLIRYLQKTRRVPGPGVDLVFLEGPGYAFGLPTPLTLSLTEAATEGRVADALRDVQPLDEGAQRAALRLLARHVSEALPGVEGENSVTTLLGAVAALGALEIGPVVDELADAVIVAVQSDSLPETDVVGAIRLGLETHRKEGKNLVGLALRHPAVTERADVAQFVAAHANAFAVQHIPRLGEVVAALLVKLPWEDPVTTLHGWSDDRAREILNAARLHLAELVASARAEEEPGEASPPPTPEG